MIELIPKEYLEPTDVSQSATILDHRVAREIDRAQEIIEEQHFQMRRTLRRYTEIVEKQRVLIYDLRNDALENKLLPEKLIMRCEETFHSIETGASFDAEELLSLIFVHELDELWMDHLLLIDSVREGIHLRRLGKRDPLLDYLADATTAFDSGLERAIECTVDRFATAAGDRSTIESLKTSLLEPANTWTYMINDNPFPSFRLSVLGTRPGADAAAAAIVAAVAAPLFILYGMWRGVMKLISSTRTGDEETGR